MNINNFIVFIIYLHATYSYLTKFDGFLDVQRVLFVFLYVQFRGRDLIVDKYIIRLPH